MSEVSRRLLLANGEQYFGHVEKKSHGGPQRLPRTYAEARDNLKWELDTSLRQAAELSARKRFADEFVLCLRLHPDLLAKTYDPGGLFATVPDLENVGSRGYRISPEKVAKTKRIQECITQKKNETSGRMIFVRSDDEGFRRLLQVLDRPESQLHKSFKEDVQKVEKFDLLTGTEQIEAFDVLSNWSEGRVEMIFHPSLHSEAEQATFLEQLLRGQSLDKSTIRMKQYANGPLFVSCYVTRAALQQAAGANPLRTAHPLNFGGLEELRDAQSFPAPPPPTTTTRSTIKVGMFDGGIDPSHPHLRGHCEQDDRLAIATSATPRGLAHGTAVAGALLYGPLNDCDIKQPLPAPEVSVVSVRVLPTSRPQDQDLYESIDVIEKAVPQRPDVRFWNLSFGPRGPITDDSISRFSYALDLLAINHKVGFAVAVGNDGEAGEGLSRIQTPSDLANGLGVGAFTRRKDQAVHAEYSCHGPGRECAKLKPDLVAFGGCSQTPIHLLSAVPGKKVLSAGTSFSTPLVTAMAGRAQGTVDRSTPLLARTLVVHTAQHPSEEPDFKLGHGLVASDLDQVVACRDQEVTILFQGELFAKQQVKLPIMVPPGLVGRVKLTWTVAALPPVQINHPADYTSLCIEDTFYPDSQVFKFTPPIELKEKPRRLHEVDDSAEIATLITAKWKKSQLPVSDSGNSYQSKHESEERQLNYKWEPLVRRSLGKQAISLNQPFLVLHAIPRHEAVQRMDFAVAVTISVPKFSGDLYSAVLTRYPALQPIRLRAQTELRIQI